MSNLKEHPNDADKAVAELQARRAVLSERMRTLRTQAGENPPRESRLELRKRLGL
jgi:hypothetical protein